MKETSGRSRSFEPRIKRSPLPPSHCPWRAWGSTASSREGRSALGEQHGSKEQAPGEDAPHQLASSVTRRADSLEAMQMQMLATVVVWSS